MQDFKAGDFSGLATTADAEVDRGHAGVVLVDKFKRIKELPPSKPHTEPLVERFVPIGRGFLGIDCGIDFAGLVARLDSPRPKVDQGDIALLYRKDRGVANFDAPRIARLVQNFNAQGLSK